MDQKSGGATCLPLHSLALLGCAVRRGERERLALPNHGLFGQHIPEPGREGLEEPGVKAVGGDHIDDGVDTAVDVSNGDTQSIQTGCDFVGVTGRGEEGYRDPCHLVGQPEDEEADHHCRHHLECLGGARGTAAPRPDQKEGVTDCKCDQRTQEAYDQPEHSHAPLFIDITSAVVNNTRCLGWKVFFVHSTIYEGGYGQQQGQAPGHTTGHPGQVGPSVVLAPDRIKHQQKAVCADDGQKQDAGVHV